VIGSLPGMNKETLSLSLSLSLSLCCLSVGSNKDRMLVRASPIREFTNSQPSLSTLLSREALNRQIGGFHRTVLHASIIVLVA